MKCEIEMEPLKPPENMPVKPRAIRHVVVVHCNFGQTDAMVVFYAQGNVDKEIFCENKGCTKRLNIPEKRMALGKEIEIRQECWLNEGYRNFID